MLQDYQIYCFEACMCALFSLKILPAEAVKGLNVTTLTDENVLTVTEGKMDTKRVGRTYEEKNSNKNQLPTSVYV